MTDLFFGESCHDILNQTVKQSLAFNKDNDYSAWKGEIREKFYTLTGLYDIEKNESPDPELNIISREQKDGYTEIRFTFASEIGTKVPCYLLIPDGKKEKYPVAITLQGHSTGYHNSVGIVKFEYDKTYTMV